MLQHIHETVCTIKSMHEKNLKIRKKPHLSCTRLLCAAGLTLCDFTNTDAAKADGYYHDQAHRSTQGSVLAQSKFINNADLNQTSNLERFESDPNVPNQRPNIPRHTQCATVTHPRPIDNALPFRASENHPQTQNKPDLSSIASNRSIDRLPHPPPPQQIRGTGSRHEQSQRTNEQPLRRQDSTIASESKRPPTVNSFANTKRNTHDFRPNTQKLEQLVPPKFANTIRSQQRRIPQHLQPASAARQGPNLYQFQHQPPTGVSSKSYQVPPESMAVPMQSNDRYNSENYPNHQHARSYQSRILQNHTEHQPSTPGPNSDFYSKTELNEPFNRDKWTQKGKRYQQYNQYTANKGRYGFGSLREPPMVSQNTRSSRITANNEERMVSDMQMGQAIHDPNNAIVSLVPRPSNSQLAIVSPSFHDAILNDRINQVQSLVEAGAWLSFGSIQKISWCLLAVGLLSYAAVSPSTLPLTEYNLQFYENFRLVFLSTIAPAIYMLFVFDPRENDINTVVNIFVITFFFGYAGIYILELIATTIVRLALFVWLEPKVFSLTPKVPVPVLPWVLREWHYRPKRITLFAADFATSCVMCPMIEESVKFFLLRQTSNLPRNFIWVMKPNNKKKKKRRVAEIVQRENGDYDCISANQYVTNMLAISVALKLADAARRILLYTKAADPNKSFYAICRGIFPIPELCGAMIAIALAKRDLLGMDIPRWKVLMPAVIVHAMANFRGKKPIFKWNASSPWSEMQLSPLNIPDTSTFLQLIKKGYAKLMWIVTISRVFGYCVKNYYMVNRHALKRTTKYAGNHAAFSAELVTTESLKNQK